MKYRSILTSIIILIPVLLSAQVDRSKAPEPGPAPEIKIGEYNSFELKNGLKVFVVENHKIPRVAYSLVLDIDPFAEGDSMGYSTIAGELLGTATTTRTKDQIDEEVDFIGASLSTSSGSVFGAALKKHNDKLLDLMSDILLNPVFNQEEMDKIKKQTISALAFNKTDPSSISGVVTDVLLYGKTHPYGEVTTEASVESVSIDMCEDYYNTYFRPNIAYLAIVGDINLKEAKKLTKKYFGEWEAADVPTHSYPAPKEPEKAQVSVVDRSHAVQSVIRVAHPVSYTVGMEDYVQARVMNLMLGGTFARLDQNLRENHSYTYGVNSSLSQDKWIGSFSVSTDVRNEVTDSAVYQILYEMDRIRTELAPSEEVERIKNYMSGAFALALEQPATVARFALNIAMYDLPEDYYANYLKYIEEVTPESVQSAAQKYLKPENCHILIVGKAGDFAEKMVSFSSDKTINYYDVEGNWIDPATMVAELPVGLTADKVVETYLAAIGGRTVLEAITDISLKMTMEVQGMNLESEILRKAPDKFYMNMSMGGNIIQLTSFNGTDGRSSGMQGEQVLEGEELESLKIQSQFLPELNYAGLGYSLKLQSIEKIDGADAYKIEITDPMGKVGFSYYDIKSGYLIREERSEETPGGPMTQITILGDYREVNDIMYPYQMIIKIGPQTISGSVTSVELNTGIEDSVFQ
ncbi:insulinase family protein [Bacteroidota bacterium]